jgi:hypothetical protein
MICFVTMIANTLIIIIINNNNNNEEKKKKFKYKLTHLYDL